MKFRLFYILLFLNIFLCCGQKQNDIPIDTLFSQAGTVNTDSLLKKGVVTDQTVFPKQFRPGFRKDYKGNSFNYETIKPRESLWERIQRFLMRKLRDWLGTGKTTNHYTEIALKVGAVLLIGFLVYLLIRYLVSKDGNFFFSRRNLKPGLVSKDLQEDIHEINFSERIADFERRGDYRSAIRYRFLKILKQLSDKKLIAWNPEKTNQDYRSELPDIAVQEQFSGLVRIFDHVWYGEFDISAEDYRYFSDKFEKAAF